MEIDGDKTRLTWINDFVVSMQLLGNELKMVALKIRGTADEVIFSIKLTNYVPFQNLRNYGRS